MRTSDSHALSLAAAAAASVACMVAVGCASSGAATAPEHCLRAAILEPSGAIVCRLECADFVRATKASAEDGVPAVALELTPAAGERLSAATVNALDRGLVATFTWDGKPLECRPFLNTQLSTLLMITGRKPGDLAACDQVLAAFAGR